MGQYSSVSFGVFEVSAGAAGIFDFDALGDLADAAGRLEVFISEIQSTAIRRIVGCWFWNATQPEDRSAAERPAPVEVDGNHSDRAEYRCRGRLRALRMRRRQYDDPEPLHNREVDREPVDSAVGCHAHRRAGGIGVELMIRRW